MALLIGDLLKSETTRRRVETSLLAARRARDADAVVMVFENLQASGLLVWPVGFRGTQFGREALTLPRTGPFARVFETGRTVRIADLAAAAPGDRSSFLAAEEFRAFLGVPLRLGRERPEALAALLSRDPRPWTAGDERALASALAEVSTTLRVARALLRRRLH